MRARALPVAVALVTAAVTAALVPTQQAIASSHTVKAHGWNFKVSNTPTDGLAVTWGEYKGTRVFKRISVPQIRVFYTANPTMNDQIGTGPGANVPYVPGSLKIGTGAGKIDVRARYQEGDWPNAQTYRYDVRYIFYDDGQFRTRVYAYGPGLEPTQTYVADFRIDLDVVGAGRDFFQHFRTNLWTAPKRECKCPTVGERDFGAEWLVYDGAKGTGWRIYPRAGDGDPDLWAVRWRDGQGNTDLGAAVADPAAYENNERLQHTNVVLWYRATVEFERGIHCPGDCKNPIMIGPLFKPFTW